MTNATSMGLLHRIISRQPMALPERIEHLAHLLQEGAGVPAGLRFRNRYGVPVLAQEDTTLDHLELSGHVARLGHPPTRLRAALPAPPEWDQALAQHAPALRHLDRLGTRNTRELQLMSALVAAGGRGAGEPAGAVRRIMSRVGPDRLERLQAELREKGMLPRRQEGETG